MKTLEIDILNPKAAKILENLADLKLISIKDPKKLDFMDVVSKIRKKADVNIPTLEEISKEVESVRTARYAKNSK